jgi:hypothetical protein
MPTVPAVNIEVLPGGQLSIIGPRHSIANLAASMADDRVAMALRRAVLYCDGGRSVSTVVKLA